MPVEVNVEGGREGGEEKEDDGLATGPDDNFFEGIVVSGVHTCEFVIVAG